MKKTLITILALGGVALGDTSAFASTTIVLGETGTTSPLTFGEYVTFADGTPDKSTLDATIISGTVDNIKYEMKHNTGRTWVIPANDTWTNTAALDIYNEATGNNLTSTMVNDMTLACSAGGSSYETFTLNFTESDWYVASQTITIFAFAGTSTKDNLGTPLNSFTVTGLNNLTIDVASATGKGFGTTYSVNHGDISLIRITGTLTSDCVVSLKGSNAKSGFAAVTLIPEPATATLSLLALAGLAARRRRK